MADGVPKIDFRELQGVLGIYQERGRRVMGELSPAIAESLHHEVLEMFETEGHGQWAPFAPSTLAARSFKPRARNKDGSLKRTKKGKLVKRRSRGNPKLLQDTGNLVGSMTPDWDEHMVEVYTNVPYAKYHASHEPRHVIPLRDFFDIDVEAFEQDVVDMMLLRLTRPEAA
jgi:phage gpG-like protein